MIEYQLRFAFCGTRNIEDAAPVSEGWVVLTDDGLVSITNEDQTTAYVTMRAGDIPFLIQRLNEMYEEAAKV